MTGFSATIAFGLVRRLAAAGTDAPSLYLLISDADAIPTIEADIAAEVQVQLGVGLRSLAAAEVRIDRLEDVFTHIRVLISCLATLSTLRTLDIPRL